MLENRAEICNGVSPYLSCGCLALALANTTTSGLRLRLRDPESCMLGAFMVGNRVRYP